MYSKKEIENEIENNEFVGVVFENGHEHTLKAYGKVCGTPFEGEMEGQFEYLNYVRRNEHTVINEVLTANSEKEAIENEIIEENGFVK